MARKRSSLTVQEPPPKLWTAREVGALLAVSPKTIANWVRAGRIRAIRTMRRGHLRFTINHINDCLKSMPEVKARIRAGKTAKAKGM